MTIRLDTRKVVGFSVFALWFLALLTHLFFHGSKETVSTPFKAKRIYMIEHSTLYWRRDASIGKENHSTKKGKYISPLQTFQNLASLDPNIHKKPDAVGKFLLIQGVS